MIGKAISHYKILEKLGEGGMGLVYKAEDTKLERTVALKFLTAQAVGSEEDKARFILEAKAAAKLDHANICTVHEIDESEGQTFIAMAYVDGQSLEERLGAGPLETREALNIVIQVAEGLNEAHRKAIVHRDIKAANIMVTADGQAKIMDFGLAKLVGRTRLTKTATIMGTVAYMSPEQAQGEAVDHRSDIWSLGVVLYKMLTGYPPFDAPSDAALIHKIIYEQMEPVSGLHGDIPPAVENIIQKALQKNPQERYQDMQSLISDLRSSRTRMVAVETKTSPSIAVLPFVDMSPAKDQEYFCDGLAEELINALTQIKDLRVVARTSAFSFKGKDARIHDIGKELRVETVLEGSVRKAGNRIRITAQLVNVSDGYHLWSEKFDRDMEDVFAIQDEISEAIVGKLKPRLLREEKAKLAKRQTVNMEAYNLYLRGRHFWNKMTEESLRKAVIFFQCAIEIEPDYAAAYAGLAHAYMDIPWYSLTRPSEVYPKARDAAFKSLELDAGLSEAAAAVGHIKTIYDWDWEGAEGKLTEAIDLNPGNSTAHLWYAYHLTLMTRFDEAIREIEIALELDPLSLFINLWAGCTFFYAGEDDRAIAAFKRTIEMEPNYIFAHSMLGSAYLRKSMIDKALNEFETEREISGVNLPATDAMRMGMYAWMGKMEDARNILNQLLARAEKEYISPFMIGLGHFSLGENDQGFEWLEKAYEERDGWLSLIKLPAIRDYTLTIRSDPRYAKLLKKMGLEP